MHTITVYNENEVKELNDIQNIQGEDKVWIDLIAPTDDVLQTFVDQFHLDRGAVELQIILALVYFLMNLINFDTYNSKSLSNNSFSNLRRIELMRTLSLIVDKTLAEKYNTQYIKHGIIKYFGEKSLITEKDVESLQKALSFSDGSAFSIAGDAKRIVSEILANGLKYKGENLSYPMKCMILVWRLRNFSAHNLSGINSLLNDYYYSILSMLFSALFFAAEIL